MRKPVGRVHKLRSRFTLRKMPDPPENRMFAPLEFPRNAPVLWARTTKIDAPPVKDYRLSYVQI